MKIQLTSVPVRDQAQALKFYTDVLGFVLRKDFPAGEHRWLTVVSPDGHADVELLLEPLGLPAAVVYQQALRDAGIPWTCFFVDDLPSEYERLLGLGVAFRMPPTNIGPAILAMFDDTCGNFIQLCQPLNSPNG